MLRFESICNNTTPDSFLNSINILVTKPHVVNKRLWGIKIWFQHSCSPLTHVWNIPETCDRLEDTSPKAIEIFTANVLAAFNLEKCYTNNNKNIVEVFVIELLPKTYKNTKAFQFICLNKKLLTAGFYNISPLFLTQSICPDFAYTLGLENKGIVLNASCEADSKSYLWLKNTLVPHFVKWIEEPIGNTSKQGYCTESLALVSKDDYYLKYNHLKLKYGKEMVKIWPECTDASKFVYEDVAIATYLLLIWEDQGNLHKKQTFVDLGCGNGLLVYILTKEGHRGVGFDIRKRNIWNMYTNDIKLEEKIITPSDVCLFPETDWIIGNHSDELTPWIPVLAAKSSYTCNFFLLPCCAYNFDGSKYQRKNSYQSQYLDYLEYIKQLCIEIGFNTYIDRLKIPSTKRICLISKGRSYCKELYHDYLGKVKEVIKRDTNTKNEDSALWINDFKPRDRVEKIKNCTSLDKKFINSIVQHICNYLLEGCNRDSKEWNSGKIVEISDIVSLLTAEHLKSLKSECGGLQTLMKNHHHIFKVQNGKVQLRYPKTLEEVTNAPISVKKRKTKNYKIRQKECWFFNNHPQGCPLTDRSCSFLHLQNDKQ